MNEVSIKVGKVDSNMSIEGKKEDFKTTLVDLSNIKSNNSMEYKDEVETVDLTNELGTSSNSSYLDSSLYEEVIRNLNSWREIINQSQNDNSVSFDIGNNHITINENEVIITDEFGRTFYIENGLYTRTIFTNGIEATMSYDENGNFIGTRYTYNGEPISILGEYNKETNQFGGSQMDFYTNRVELLEDPKIISIMRESFPYDTLEDYELYFCAIASVGCGYVAYANSIFLNFEGREEDFYNTFGFPMYTVDVFGNIDYNYDYLILEVFNGVWANRGYTIQELYGDTTPESLERERQGYITDRIITGMNTPVEHTDSSHNPEISTYTTLNQWLFDKYDIQVDREELSLKELKEYFAPYTEEWEELNKYQQERFGISTQNPDTPFYGQYYPEVAINAIKTALEENKYVIIANGGLSELNLYDVSGNINETRPHVMLVTRITEDRIYVSSWGNEWYFLISEIEKIHNIQIMDFIN